MSERVNRQMMLESLDWEESIPLLTGGALLAIGLQKRSVLGWALAAMGGGLAAYGFASRRLTPQPKNVDWLKRCITVNDSGEAVYDFWAKPENLVKIFPGVKSIEPEADGCWLWRVALPSHKELTFRTENVTTDRPWFMHWKTTDDEAIDHHGKVEFRKAASGAGTEVELRLTWRGRGVVTQALASLGLIGGAAAWESSEVLRRSKQLIETGELASVSTAD